MARYRRVAFNPTGSCRVDGSRPCFSNVPFQISAILPRARALSGYILYYQFWSSRSPLSVSSNMRIANFHNPPEHTTTPLPSLVASRREQRPNRQTMAQLPPQSIKLPRQPPLVPSPQVPSTQACRLPTRRKALRRLQLASLQSKLILPPLRLP